MDWMVVTTGLLLRFGFVFPVTSVGSFGTVFALVISSFGCVFTSFSSGTRYPFTCVFLYVYSEACHFFRMISFSCQPMDIRFIHTTMCAKLIYENK